MPYLIDGHNLIPHLGLRLDDPDDEDTLIASLQEFCRLRRVKLEVFFDAAPAGFPPSRKAGAVTAYFIRQGGTADAAILDRLAKLGRTARNWNVVSSDRQVQSAARAAHARVLGSDEFAAQVKSARHAYPAPSGDVAYPGIEEVDEWLALFRHRKG